MIDVVVRKVGRSIPTDENGGTQDRPPTSKIELGHRDPIVQNDGAFPRPPRRADSDE